MRSSTRRSHRPRPGPRLLDLNQQPDSLALSREERERVIGSLGREPSTVEWFAFDAQWSEHCSYKSSRHLLRKLPTEGPAVMQGPAEDAGILHLGEWNGEKWGVVLAQDFSNMAAVQKGMRSRGFRGTLPNPHQERKVTNFHRNLAKYMGTGAPRRLKVPKGI